MSEPKYYTMKLIDDNLAIIEMKKVKVKMNKPIYLGLLILDIIKLLCKNFGMNLSKVNPRAKQNFVIWIQIALLLI